MSLQPNSVLGPYQIGGVVGEGGMGVVYRAKDTRLGRDVAIKVLTNVAISDRERLLRFEQEARATGMLNHPNLLTIYDVGRDDEDNPYLVSELLEGETLTTRLVRGALSPRKAVDAALQMALGLAAAHEKGVVHRDLKPDNIFLTRDGRLKILDFGIAKLTGHALSDGPTFEVAATEPGMVLGTVGYMSPEQVRGESVDHRSDLFSLGAIFYEMLSGARAFKRNSGIETLSAILKEEPPDLTEILPAIPPTLERLVRRCLEKDREVRFQSARDLAFNLEMLSTMSATHTLPNVARVTTGAYPAQSQAHAATSSGLHPAATDAQTAIGPVATSATRAHTPTTRQPARPLTKPKRRISPILLVLLYAVSIAGAAYGGWLWAQRAKGTPVEPAFHRLTFRRGEVRTARYSSDGESIVYSAAWDGKPPEIFVVSRGATESRSLGMRDSDVLAVSKASELAVLLRRDRLTNLGTLARVPLAGGTPREVAENVLQADWSPDGAELAIIRQNGTSTRVEYPIGTLKYETPYQVRHVRVAPDGKRLAILEISRGEYNVAIIEDRKQPVTIARGWGRGATGIAWSPDGRQIWVSGTSSGAPPALYSVDIEQGIVRLVTRLTGGIRIFDLSPKGEALLSNSIWRAALVWKAPDPPAPAPPENPQSSILNPQSVAPPVSPETDASWLDWSALADLSADGRNILFSETREGGGAKGGVYLRRASDPAPIRLGDGIGDSLSPDGRWALCRHGAKLVLVPTGSGQHRELNIGGAFDNGAVWLPDSRRVIVAGIMEQNGGYQLIVIDTLDETASPISPEKIWGNGSRAFAVSPDGLRVAGMTAEQTIALYSLDGSTATPLAGAVKGEIPIQWSADGATIFVHDPTALPARVHRIHLATGLREPWKEFMPPDPAGVYKIAPVLITPTGNAYAYNAMRVLSELYVAEGLK
ncbi:MAG: protein kinase [Acidobacteriota bacterium]|nr:protein kinase [Acidobacteriota bacterium]